VKLEPERWGSPLVQEKYREEMLVTETYILYNNNNKGSMDMGEVVPF